MTYRPLIQADLSTFDASIGSLLEFDREDELDMDAPYQRDHVWTQDMQLELWHSILSEVPVGAIYLNTRPDFEYTADAKRYVVDGKQRVTAILAFIKGDLQLPRAWFEQLGEGRSSEYAFVEDGESELVSYSDLTRAGRNKLNRFRLTFMETKLPDEQAEAELFLKLNTSGVRQQDLDIERAQQVAKPELSPLDQAQGIAEDKLTDDMIREMASAYLTGEGETVLSMGDVERLADDVHFDGPHLRVHCDLKDGGLYNQKYVDLPLEYFTGDLATKLRLAGEMRVD